MTTAKPLPAVSFQTARTGVSAATDRRGSAAGPARITSRAVSTDSGFMWATKS